MVIRSVTGIAFVYAGSLKLLDPWAFAWNIYQYGLVPGPLIEPLAIGLPVAEIVSGVALIADRRWSYGAVAGMLVLFTGVLGHALINGLNVDCGCFGSGEPGPAGLRSAMLRNAVMLAGIAMAWRERGANSVQGRTDGTISSKKEDAS